MSVNNNDDALACYKKSLELNPNDAQTWEFLGKLLKSKEMYSETSQAYDKALELKPKNESLKKDRDELAAQLNKS